MFSPIRNSTVDVVQEAKKITFALCKNEVIKIK
jgi:hypothetical protein